MKSNREVKERIYKIASHVYEVDESEPDIQQFAIEEEIWELLSDLGLPTDKLYTEDEVRQAALSGAKNERIHWMRKLKGLRGKMQFGDYVGVDSMIVEEDVIDWIDKLLSQAESDK